MNAVELYGDLDTFYQIRADNYAKEYLLKFIDDVVEKDVNLNYLGSHKIQFDFRGKNKTKYNEVLDQFIRYVQTVYRLRHQKQTNHKKHSKTKIHNTFYDLQKKTKEKLL